MPVVAWRIGNEPFYTYTLLVYLGLLSGAGVLALEGRRRGWSRTEILEVLAWALVPAVLGGRAAYVAGHWADYAPDPRALLRPWGDGLSWPGVLAGGALGLGLLSLWRRRPYLPLLGAAMPGLALGQALGWLGAAAHGAHAGVALPLDWRWAPHLRNLYGLTVPRLPLQYVASALSLLACLAMLHPRLRGDRERIACYALLTGWGLAGLGWAEEGRTALAAGLSLEQMAGLALGLVGLALAFAPGRRPRLAAGPS